MSLDGSPGVLRMCMRCGKTQILEKGLSPAIYDWFTVEGSVVGDDCEIVVAKTDATVLGYIPPTTS